MNENTKEKSSQRILKLPNCCWHCLVAAAVGWPASLQQAAAGSSRRQVPLAASAGVQLQLHRRLRIVLASPLPEKALSDRTSCSDALHDFQCSWSSQQQIMPLLTLCSCWEAPWLRRSSTNVCSSSMWPAVFHFLMAGVLAPACAVAAKAPQYLAAFVQNDVALKAVCCTLQG